MNDAVQHNTAGAGAGAGTGPDGQVPNRLAPSPYNRVAFVGKTGSGKSYAAWALLLSAKRLVVCDVVGKINRGWGEEGWNLQDFDKGYNDLLQGKPARLYIEPQLSVEEWEAYFWKVYKCRGVTLYIDELSGVHPRENRALKALYTRGRHYRIGVMASMQRPASIPLESLSEAEWYFLFKLQMKDDVDRMVYLMGDAARRKLYDHQLLVYNDKFDDAEFFERITLQVNTPKDEEVSTNV